MKKYFNSAIAVIMCVLMLSSCGSGNMYTIKTRTDADGNVRKEVYSAEEKIIKREDISPEGEITSAMEYSYDKDGNLTKSSYAYEGYWQTTEYTYDEKGNNILSVITDSDEYESRIEYVYNENGYKEKQIIKTSDGQDFSIKYTYDENGNLIKEKQKGYDGNESVSTYTYDENGNMILKETTNLTGYVSIEEKTYDENGNVTVKKDKSSHFEGALEDESMTVYTYDEKGNLIKEEHSDSEGKEWVKEYTYAEEQVKKLE